MRIALIENNIVINIAEFNHYFVAQKTASDINLIPVNVDDIPVEIGDTYQDGNFYRDGDLVGQEGVLPIISDVDRIAALEEAVLTLAQGTAMESRVFNMIENNALTES